MRTSIKFHHLGLFISFMFIMSSCVYEVIIPPDLSGETISFQDDIMPIFDASCNTQGCHATGAFDPDLTLENAYDALWSGGYIDTLDPGISELYLWVSNQKPIAMPPGAYDPVIAETILTWIEQGAPDN